MQRSQGSMSVGLTGTARLLAVTLTLCVWQVNEAEEGPDALERVVLAAGCFWSVELAYQRLPGVEQTRVGYIGGVTVNPTYETVSTGVTGHAEAVEVVFNPLRVSRATIFQLFFSIHDATQLNRQGGDVGTQYRSAVWVEGDLEVGSQAIAYSKAAAEHKSKHNLPSLTTEIHELSGATFWPAEAYHQKVCLQITVKSPFYPFSPHYLEKGGQSAAKGSLDTIRCYGDRGPRKVLDKPGLRELYQEL